MIFIILVILVAAVILNSYLMKREARRKENEHERREERFERLMNLLQKPNSDKNDEVSNLRDESSKLGTTEADKNSKS